MPVLQALDRQTHRANPSFISFVFAFCYFSLNTEQKEVPPLASISFHK